MEGTVSNSQNSTAGGAQRVLPNTELTVHKLILFIACVINCTDQAKHKTEKIKITVRGAEQFLALKDVSWEQINKRLEVDGKTGITGDRT